jgi:hypothetical protein
MPFPVLDSDFFISLVLEPDHSKYDSIRWSYDAKFKDVIRFQNVNRDANTLTTAQQMFTNFVDYTYSVLRTGSLQDQDMGWGRQG